MSSNRDKTKGDWRSSKANSWNERMVCQRGRRTCEMQQRLFFLKCKDYLKFEHV